MDLSSGSMKGDLRTLIRLSIPFFLFLFCRSLTTFCESVFLSYYSNEAVPGSLNAAYLVRIFQESCLAIASMAQVFVGFYQGSGDLKRIGPCVWQLIWFSLLSILVTLPLSYWGSLFYFKETSIEQSGISYANILALGNFLFPLSTALMSFYLGRGKTIVVTVGLLGCYALNIIFSKVLILGVGEIVPALGAQGAAIAKCLSLGLFCLVFFCFFLKKTNRDIYNTGCYQFSLTELKSYMRPGIVRAFAHFWTGFCWIASSYLMVKKGGLYLDVHTVGGTISLFCLFTIGGMYQSVLTVASNLLGAKDYSEVWKLCYTVIAYSTWIGIFLAVPFFLYPQCFAYFFDISSKETFKNSFSMIHHWVWLYLIMAMMQMGLSAIIVATKDLKIQLYSYFCTFLTSLLPVYVTLTILDCKPDNFWFIIMMENLVFALAFFGRLYQRRKREGQLLCVGS